MPDFTFNVALTAAFFVGMLASIRRHQHLTATVREMRKAHQDILGEIQKALAKVSGDVDRLHHLMPDGEAARITQGLVTDIDQIILIIRGDFVPEPPPPMEL